MKDMRNNDIDVNSLEKELRRYTSAMSGTYCQELLDTAMFIDEVNRKRYEETGKYWFIPRALVPYAYECYEQLLRNVYSYGCDWEWAFGEDGMTFVLVEDVQCPADDRYKDEELFEAEFDKEILSDDEEEETSTAAKEQDERCILLPTDFEPLKVNSLIASLYSLRKISSKDLFFTDGIDDGRINTTVSMSDYDWMTYTYDARIPTKDIGTLVVRFEYCGSTESDMYVKQFLPSYLTKEDKNYVVCHRFEYPTEIFDRFFYRDLQNRVRNSNESYAYYAGDLVLDWFNTVLENGKRQSFGPVDTLDDFAWNYVVIPKQDNFH